MFYTKYFHYLYLQSPYLKFSSPYSFDMTSIFLYRSILCWKREMFDLSHCVLYWFYEKWQNSWSCFCAWSKDLTIVSKQQECVFILYLIVSLPMQQCYNMFSNKQKWLLLIVFIGHKNVIYSLTFVVGRKFRRVYDGRNIDCHASLVFMSIRYNKPQKTNRIKTIVVWSSFLWESIKDVSIPFVCFNLLVGFISINFSYKPRKLDWLKSVFYKSHAIRFSKNPLW